MAVPRQVREQAEAADRALEEVMKTGNQGSQDTAVQDAQAPNNAMDGAPAQPESVQAPNEPATPDVPGEAVVPEPSAKASEAEADRIRQELERERQLRRTLEGRIASQLKPAHEANRQLKAEIDELKAQVKEMAEGPPKPGAMRYITEDEANELGQEIIDVQSRIVKGIVEEETERGSIASRLNAIQELREAAMGQAQAEPGTPKPGFWDEVERLSPDARAINRDDPGWVDFLDTYDAYSGRKYREAAMDSFGSDDPSRLAGIIDAYKASGWYSRPAPPAARQAPAQPVPAPDQAASPFVSADGNLVNGGARFTRHQVEAFFNNLARGRFKGRETEAQKIEDQIMAAAQAGLITG